MKSTLYILPLLLFPLTWASGQAEHYKNSFEVSLFTSNQFSSVSNIQQRIDGEGFILKAKRILYRDDINQFSLGLISRHANLRLKLMELENGQVSNSLSSNQKADLLGLNISNRFSLNFWKVNWFMDIELAIMYALTFNQATNLYSSCPWCFNQANAVELPLENELRINKIIPIYNMQTGIDFSVHERLNLFFAIGYSRNAGPIFKDNYLSSHFASFPEIYFGSFSINLGGRF